MFPEYSYVTGKFPHPIRDPRGHSYGHEASHVEPPTANDWKDCRPYLRGIELFNHGYYWEAHESWEAVWMAAGRTGATADFLKALIKLAAAGVKAREGRPAGVQRHARRAVQLLGIVRDVSTDNGRYFGLDLNVLQAHARSLIENPQAIVDVRDEPVVVVMPFALELG